jgi:hypothetical protein
MNADMLCPWCKSPPCSDVTSAIRCTTTDWECGSSIGCAHQLQSSACKRIERLQAIVNRLPKTADGVPITLGDDLWSNDSRGTFEWCVTEIHTHDVCGKFHGAPCVFEQYGNCYSTREAAEKARKP